MGIRFTFYAVHRSAFEELADTSLTEIARRAGWPVSIETNDGETSLRLGPTSLYAEVGPRLDPEQSLRTLAQSAMGDALWVIDELARSAAWPSLRRVQRGYKRWWIGGLVHPLRPHERQRYTDALDLLARMVQPNPVQVPWFDARIRAVADSKHLTGPILRAPSRQDDWTCMEVDPTVLEPLLQWADSVDAFAPPPRERSVTDTDWDRFVREHVRVLRMAGTDEALLSALV